MCLSGSFSFCGSGKGSSQDAEESLPVSDSPSAAGSATDDDRCGKVFTERIGLLFQGSLRGRSPRRSRAASFCYVHFCSRWLIIFDNFYDGLLVFDYW